MHRTRAVQLTTVVSAHAQMVSTRIATVQPMRARRATRLPLLHRLLVALALLAVAVVLRTVLLHLAKLAFIRTVLEHALSVRLLLGPHLTRRTAAHLLLTAK